MAVPALQRMRHDLRLNADAQVRVVFEGEHRVPVFECEPCEDLLRWNAKDKWWTCPRCGYELTPVEAEDLMVLARRRISIVLTDVRRKKDGRWRRLFRRLAQIWSRSFKRG
jgi:hypothetical protein